MIISIYCWGNSPRTFTSPSKSSAKVWQWRADEGLPKISFGPGRRSLVGGVPKVKVGVKTKEEGLASLRHRRHISCVRSVSNKLYKARSGFAMDKWRGTFQRANVPCKCVTFGPINRDHASPQWGMEFWNRNQEKLNYITLFVSCLDLQAEPGSNTCFFLHTYSAAISLGQPH